MNNLHPSTNDAEIDAVEVNRGADDAVYCATPLGILSVVLPSDQAKAAWNALELHMRRHYGPVAGIVVDGDTVCFTRLEKGAADDR